MLHLFEVLLTSAIATGQGESQARSAHAAEDKNFPHLQERNSECNASDNVDLIRRSDLVLIFRQRSRWTFGFNGDTNLRSPESSLSVWPEHS